MTENFTQLFIRWIEANRARLASDKMTVHLPEGPAANGTYADFFAGSGEATVEIWDYGFGEFHVLDPYTEEIKTTHYEFQNASEMYAALETLVSRMSPMLAVR